MSAIDKYCDLFVYFREVFGSKIKQQLLQRHADIQQIEHAKQEYNNIIAKAQTEVDAMINQGKQHKEKLLQEAQLLAKRKKQKSLRRHKTKQPIL